LPKVSVFHWKSPVKPKKSALSSDQTRKICRVLKVLFDAPGLSACNDALNWNCVGEWCLNPQNSSFNSGIVMKFKSTLLGALVFGSALLVTSGQLMASGSIGASAPRSQGSKSYSMGKQIYMKRIACASCSMPGGVANSAEAKVLIDRIGDEEFKLSAAEQTDTKTYLMRRFKVK
jgi:hypothetical protein